MKVVFLDTVGMIGVWDESDQWHPAATEAFAKLLAEGARLVTTALVLAECANASARRPYRNEVCEMRRAMRAEGLLIEPSDEEIELAWSAYERGDSAQAGIVDQISFMVMRRFRIAEAFTNDRHFQAAGFITLF